MGYVVCVTKPLFRKEGCGTFKTNPVNVVMDDVSKMYMGHDECPLFSSPTVPKPCLI